MKKRIAILGSTGSIGAQALEVVRGHPDLFRVTVLTANDNCDLLISQAMEFLPEAVVIGNEACYPKVREALKERAVQVHAGREAIAEIVRIEGIDLVLTALVGYSGLKPTLNAINAGKQIALANKETLVIAGDLVMAAAKRNNVRVIPVDSEHSAVFQCLAGEDPGSVEKIILTASGGPFFGKTREELSGITREEALKHPNWKMGNKITIDSATMMNKGLEVIEACWLFDVKSDQVEVTIHPQSVIHSMVRFIDGSIKAQLGRPDMKLPILYALAYPRRIASGLKPFSFADYPQLTFHAPDPGVFRNLSLAYEALARGGNMPCILNAANEIAVSAFLENAIRFPDIPEVIEHCMGNTPFIKEPGYEDYVASHCEAMTMAENFIQNHKQIIH